jgi:hypothetical protein
MNQSQSFIVLLALLSASACCSAGDTSPQCDEHERESYDHTDYPWQSVRPAEYLNYLSSLSTVTFTVWGCRNDWVSEEDIPILLDLLDSKVPCPNQTSASSSFIDVKRSTVGIEAAWLIHAFRVGRFPAGLNSTRDSPDPAELRSWWKERQERSIKQPSNTSLERTREG